MIQTMQKLIIFGSIGLVLITKTAFSTDETVVNKKTSQCTTPLAYNIHLEIENNNRLKVASRVILNVSCPQPYIRLYIGRYCDITNITVKPDVPYNFPVRWKPMYQNSTKDQFKHVNLRLFKGFKNERLRIGLHGLYTINPMYNCTLEKVATVSTYLNKTTGKKEFMILPRIPAEWIFPYWEDPAIKARFTIRITHEHNETALTNMPSTRYLPLKKFYRIFDTFPSISTHSIAVAVVPNIVVNYITLSDGIITYKYWANKDTTYAQNVIYSVINNIINTWFYSIPLSRHVTSMVVPANFSFHIVTSGLLLFSEVDIICNTEVDSIIKKRQVRCLVTRNVLQEMFSDWLPSCRQSDLWFIEGFLTVYGIHIRDMYYRSSFLESFVIQTRRQFLDYTEAFLNHDFPIQETLLISQNSTLRNLWQVKAFSTFYMLNTVFGGDFLYTSMFKEALYLYYNTTVNNTYNKQSLLDNKLWTWKLETSAYKSGHFPTLDAKSMINSWTDQIGYPVIQVKRQNVTQSLTIMIVDCFDVDQKEMCERKWWIPVTFYKITTEIIFPEHHFLQPYDNSIIFIPFVNENEFAIVVDSTGFRVNYDRQSWKNIALYLKNEDPSNWYHALSDVTLAQILDDAFYFLVQNTQYNENPASDDSDLHIYLDLANSVFDVKNSYIAWYPLLTALEKISTIFLFPESLASTKIKVKLIEMFNRFLDDTNNNQIEKHMSYTIKSSENVTDQLYHEVLKWTCILGGLKCNEHVYVILNWHFNNSAKNTLLPSWQRWLYCQGIKFETLIYEMSALWKTILNIYRTQKKEGEFLEVLPCSRQYNNMYRFLRYLDRNSLPLPGSSFKESDTGNIVNAKKSDTVTVLFNMFALHSTNESALDSIIVGIENGIGSDVSILAILNCVINNIYSEKGLAMITKETFLRKQLYMYQKKPFVLEAIKKKVEDRRSFLVKMQHYIRHRPHYVLSYNSITN